MKFNFEVWKVKLGLDLTNLSVPVTLSEKERNEFFGSLNEFIDNFWKPDESGPYPSCSFASYIDEDSSDYAMQIRQSINLVKTRKSRR